MSCFQNERQALVIHSAIVNYQLFYQSVRVVQAHVSSWYLQIAYFIDKLSEEVLEGPSLILIKVLLDKEKLILDDLREARYH